MAELKAVVEAAIAEPAEDAPAAAAVSVETACEVADAAPTVILAEPAPCADATPTASAESAPLSSAVLTPAVLGLRALEYWNDNALAVVAFAEDIGKAQGVDDVVEMQTRFVNQRVDAAARQARELFALMFATPAFAAFGAVETVRSTG